MRSIQLKIIYLTTVVTICSLYAAQPIQPIFQTEFNLTEFQAILFTTLMMGPLGIAPLFYGFVLEAKPVKQVLRSAILAMAVLEICFSLASNYRVLLALRAAQGLVIPALLTSLMSYISYTCEREKIQQSIASYIAATIVGGFLGRMLSGVLTDFFGWRLFFFILGIAFLVIYFKLNKLQDHIKAEYVKPRISLLFSILKQGQFLWIYLCIFGVFFVFGAVMNFLPFQIMSMKPEYGGAGIGLLYIGYSIGIYISISNQKIRSMFNHETSAIAVGLAIYIIGTAIFLIENYFVMFVGMFVFCSGMFMAHSLLSGYLNSLGQEQKAIANGLYISFYYMGGAFGSLLPSFILARYNWTVFVYCLIAVLVLCCFCIWRLRAVIFAQNRM